MQECLPGLPSGIQRLACRGVVRQTTDEDGRPASRGSAEPATKYHKAMFILLARRSLQPSKPTSFWRSMFGEDGPVRRSFSRVGRVIEGPDARAVDSVKCQGLTPCALLSSVKG
jgi:hypothetical protein